MYGLTVENLRCLDGIELIELPSTGLAGAEGTLASGVSKPKPGEPESPTPLIFRHRTERVETARLEFTNLEKPVVIDFINAGDDEGLRKFFDEFGLTIPGSQVDRDETLRNQKNLRHLLETTNIGSATVAVRTANDIIAQLAGAELLPIWHQAGRRGAPHVVLKSKSLLAFMLMEVANAAAYGAQLSTCQRCGTAFLTGKMTMRRTRAKFCSDRCRVAAMRARQAAGN